MKKYTKNYENVTITLTSCMLCVSQFCNTNFITKHKKNYLRRSVILSKVAGHQSKILISIITSQVLFTFLRVFMWYKFVIHEILLNSWIELLGQFFQLIICSFTPSTLFRMGLFWTAHGLRGEGAKSSPSPKFVTHILNLWNLAQLYLTWGGSKNI